MIVRPVRIQRRRSAGFNLAAHSRSMNGLPAIYVGRPTMWGNPWHVMRHRYDILRKRCAKTAGDAVLLYRLRMAAWETCWPGDFRAHLHQSLGGHNLACWCAPGAPCHADVLLELANP